MTSRASCSACSACRSAKRKIVKPGDSLDTIGFTMSTLAKKVEFARDLKRIELHKSGKKKMLPRELIRIRLRCRLCVRARAVYRKFGICRICFRNMASNGLIPGVQKASW